MHKHYNLIRKLRESLFYGIAVLLAMVCMACADEKPQEGLISVEKYWALFPHTLRHGNCLLTRVDNCKLIAVMNPNRSKAEIAIVFVQGESWKEIQKMAQNLRSDYFSGYIVKPFQKKNGVALLAGNRYLNTTDLPTGNPLPIMMDNGSFATWDGRRVLLDFETEQLGHLPSPTENERNTRPAKAIGAISVAVYPEEFHASHVKLTLTKRGNLSSAFIMQWFQNYLDDNRTPSGSHHKKTMLRDKYNLDALYINDSANICIGKSGRDYYLGAISKIDHAIGKKAVDTKPFDFKEQKHDYQTLPKNPDIPAPNARSAIARLLISQPNHYDHFRVGSCYVDCIFDSEQPDYLQMAFVTSYDNKKEAHATAQRIAQALGDDYKVKPFAKNAACVAIYTPRISMRKRVNSTLNLLFTPGLGMKQSVEFIGWKNIPPETAELTHASTSKQYLVVEIPVETPYLKGRVQITLDPYEQLTDSITEMRIVEGKVNFGEMLMDGRLCEVDAGRNSYKEKPGFLAVNDEEMRLLENGKGNICFLYSNSLSDQPTLFSDKLVAKNKPDIKITENWIDPLPGIETDSSDKGHTAEPANSAAADKEIEQTVDMTTAQESNNLSSPARNDTSKPQISPGEALKAYLNTLKNL